jgi:hypothetical protein
MKLQLAVSAALAAQLFVAAPSFAGKGDASSPLATPAVLDCDAGLTAQPTFAPGRVHAVHGFEVDGAMLNVALVRTGPKSLCAVQTAPERRALSAAEYADLQQLSALQGGGGLPDLTHGGSTAKSMSGAAIATVWPGYCGAPTSSSPIASAFFLAQRLALSAGTALPPSVTDKLCLQSNGRFYDVHATRRSGAGQEEMVSLSLMQPAPSSTGFTVYPLNTGSGNLAARGAVNATLTGAQSGAMKVLNDNQAQFLAGRSVDSAPTPLPSVMLGGGSGWVMNTPAQPFGVHTWTSDVRYPATYPESGWVTERRDHVMRFKSTDSSILTSWSNSAAAPAAQQVTITYPAYDQLVNSAAPVNVSVSAYSLYTLELDGRVVSKSMTVAPGWHTLVAYLTSQPKYRHTIRFQAQPMATPDAFEVDDTRAQAKPLYEGTPQQHNFHLAGNKDWAAFAVGPNQRSTVTMAGSLANWASVTLYRQLNYPYGAIERIWTDGGKTQLIMSGDSGPDGTTAFYVEASSAMHGAGTEYVLAVTTAPLPDAYEVDDVREQFHALYEGQPQTHTFHSVNDEDWTGFAVGPGVTSRVALGGAVAAHASVELHRHVDYPNGAIELVASNAAVGGEVSVEHTAPVNESLGVYYVRVRPFNQDPNAARYDYTLSVSTR